VEPKVAPENVCSDRISFPAEDEPKVNFPDSSMWAGDRINGRYEIKIFRRLRQGESFGIRAGTRRQTDIGDITLLDNDGKNLLANTFACQSASDSPANQQSCFELVSFWNRLEKFTRILWQTL